jgi:sulfur carrier protein ThiS
MKVRVNLYGTLCQKIPGYRQSQGIEVEVPEGATVKELLSLLQIPVLGSEKAVVAIDGRIRKTNDEIPSDAHAQVFQPMHGG